MFSNIFDFIDLVENICYLLGTSRMLPAHGFLVGTGFLAGLYLLYLAGRVAHHLLHVLQALDTDSRGPGHRLQRLLVTSLHQGEHAIHDNEDTERYWGRFF